MYSKLLSLSVFAVLACANPSRNPINKFSDPVLLSVADLQDRRMADSLSTYFTHENPVYRQEAVRAFGSIQDTAHIDKIGRLLLMDADAAVRKAAAFSLGQIQHSSCERLLLAALVKEKIPENIFELLQAYGKNTSQWNLKPDTFFQDSLKASGIAWSIYRAGLRGKTDTVANSIASQLLSPNFSSGTRLGAAHFFARGARDFHASARPLVRAALSDSLPEVRMAAALALGGVGAPETLSTLKTIIDHEEDARVVTNAVRALGSFAYDSVRNYLYAAAQHKNVNVAIAASEIIARTVPEVNWIEVSALANRVTHWRTLPKLYEGALRAGQHKDVAAEIQSYYREAKDPWQRAAWLESLKQYAPAYAFVEKELRTADTAVVRSAAVSALVGMNYSDSFRPAYKSRFADMYRALIQSSGDPVVIGTIAAALADSTLGYRTVFKDAAFLHEAKARLRLPRHIEALQPLEAAIAYLEGKKTATVKNEFNHPINWALVRKIPADQRVTIKTSRGHIVVRLLVEEAPGSVANFVTLAEQNYFDNKVFHRVVPNFVVQAGCNRGDGWGSEEYSIRSEFSTRRYRAGSVGMASAGKDTEGTQWFITHSPTPHLDGRYTLFAEVIEGRRVLDYIQVGDKITDVVVENFNGQ